MAVLFLGTDFREARALDLELLETHASQIRVILARNQDLSAGAVVLATCNRFEMYLDSANFPDAVAKARAAITEVLGEPGIAIANRLEIRTGDDVVQHLFSVSSGLESMVIGEGEISGQVKSGRFLKPSSFSPPALRSRDFSKAPFGSLNK